MLFVEDVDSDDDDDDFIEVAAKEGFEPMIPHDRREEYGFALTSSSAKSWQQKDHQLDIEDPTSIIASVFKRRQLEQEKLVARLGEITIAEMLLPCC